MYSDWPLYVGYCVLKRDISRVDFLIVAQIAQVTKQILFKSTRQLGKLGNHKETQY